MTAQQELELGGTTYLATYLNAAMSRDASARATYASIYGVEWAPLGDGTEISDGADSRAVTCR